MRIMYTAVAGTIATVRINYRHQLIMELWAYANHVAHIIKVEYTKTAKIEAIELHLVFANFMTK